MEINDHLKLEVSEQFAIKKCDLNSQRLSVIVKIFLKACKNSKKLQELFAEEINELNNIESQEEEYQKSLQSIIS